MKIELQPIGYVRGGRAEATDDDWDAVQAEIELDGTRFTAESLTGLWAFSHAVIVYCFHKVDPKEIEYGARRPRGNPGWNKVGIFSQRCKNRPNLIGVSTCRILGVDDIRIRVQDLDALDGTPVLDIKPYMKGFEPRSEVKEPDWAGEIMTRYWQTNTEASE